MTLFNPYNRSVDGWSFVSTVSKLGLKEMKQLASDHITSSHQDWDTNPGLSEANTHVLSSAFLWHCRYGVP